MMIATKVATVVVMAVAIRRILVRKHLFDISLRLIVIKGGSLLSTYRRYNFDESEKSQSLFIPNHEHSRGNAIGPRARLIVFLIIFARVRAIDYADDVLFEEIVVINYPVEKLPKARWPNFATFRFPL